MKPGPLRIVEQLGKVSVFLDKVEGVLGFAYQRDDIKSVISLSTAGSSIVDGAL
jgi:hypothetical protein